MTNPPLTYPPAPFVDWAAKEKNNVKHACWKAATEIVVTLMKARGAQKADQAPAEVAFLASKLFEASWKLYWNEEVKKKEKTL